jgi:hypothetical protein
VTASYDREKSLELIHGWLEHQLSSPELRDLDAVLRQEPAARRDLILASALHQELFALHEVPVPHGSILELRETGDSGGKRTPTLRSSRRFSREVRESSLAPALLTAASLAAAVLLFLVFRSETRTPVSPRHESVRIREVGVPAAPAGAGQNSGAAPDAAAAEKLEEERIRAESSRRLADLERRRAALAQPGPQDSDPKRAQEQKSDLALLEEEKRRIEEEMKLAIEQARRMPRGRPGETVTKDPAASGPDQAPAGKASVIASVERVEGDGFILRKEVRIPAREGAEVLSGDGLETMSAAGRLVLRFGDRSRLELRGETSLSEITEDASAAAPAGKQIQMSRGTVAAEVAKQPAHRPMLLRTPHSEATVLGTSFRISVDPGEKGATRLEVQEGKVRFTRQIEKKASVEVNGGHYAVSALGIPLQSRPIPPPRTGTPEKPVLIGLLMLNAETGRPLLQFDPLEDGTVITLADLPTRALNIQAITSPGTVGSVLFNWDGSPVMEGRAPYLLGGNDQRGKPLAWTPAPGEHTLTVTPYSGPPAANKREGTGTAGAGVTVRLRVR